ncbi:uncharacterized protein si:ch211-248a14.8 isoform X2 [Engraulis encrasicolus]|uniref:uncharacterized protein si:ch211-248a14.8 isoform X2 n=1 Tax=Engraulis encrasicolus TaxID=184585 RepID=UPI002FD5A9DC
MEVDHQSYKNGHYSSQCRNFLVFCGVVLALVLYAQVNRLHSLVCGIFIPQYHYPYAVPLTFAQVIIIYLVWQLLHGVGVVSLRPYSLRLGEQMLVPAVCGSAQAVLELWAQASTHSGLYPLVTRLLPVLSVLWSHLLALNTTPRLYWTGLLAGVTLSSIAIKVAMGVHFVEPLEWVYAPLSVLLHSLSLAWMSKVAEAHRHRHGTVFDCYYSLVVMRVLVQGFLCLLHPDGPKALAEGNWFTLLFIGYLLAIILLGALQHILVDMTALYFSPLAASLLYSARELALPFYSLLLSR